MINSRLAASMESIDFQTGGMLFHDLTLIFGEVQRTRRFSDKEKEKANKVIRKHTGINAVFYLEEHVVPDAATFIPSVDRSHPLKAGLLKDTDMTSRDLGKAIKRGVHIRGMVDRKKSRVSGHFSDLAIPIVLTTPLLDDFSDREVASVILHELGHIFTYFEYMGRFISTNHVLDTAARQMMNTDNVKQRYLIVRDTNDFINATMEEEEKEGLVNNVNETTFRVIMVRKAMEKPLSDVDSPLHDMTGWEALSDQFATRHGAGRDLVTALDKLNRLSSDSVYQGKVGYFFAQAVKSCLAIIFVPFTITSLFAIWYLGIVPGVSTYDKPKARIERIRNDLAAGLKGRNISSERKAQLVQDIEVVDNVLKEMSDKRGLFELIWTALSSKSRDALSQKRFQQELERIVNNDIYVQSARFSNLSF